MVSEAPSFWWTKADWRAFGLWPISFLYGRIAGRRMAKANPPQAPVPVICVGNFTVGGAGKTPTALAIARAAREKGLKPGFLSRGYGGSLDVTTVVDLDHHRADAVGDEALLLAREGLTVVCRKRVEGARRLASEGADIIIMDDGFQSARLAIDYGLIVLDASRGIGNGHLIPGGPLRAPVGEQMRHVSAILKVGEGHAADPLIRKAARAGRQIHVARLEAKAGQSLAGRNVLAFTGIGDPEKFYRTINAIGGLIAVRKSFPDHHFFTEDEMRGLIAEADRQSLAIVTTTKDAARLAGHRGVAAELSKRVEVIEVEMVFDDGHAPGAIIDAAIDNFRTRRLKAGHAARP